MTKDNSGPAFPPHGDTFEYEGVQSGMTLRDWFAGEALSGMLAHSTRYKPREIDNDLYWHEAIAKEAYELADAMLEARKK